MKELIRKHKKLLWLIFCLLLTLTALFCLWRIHSLSRSMSAQQAAERWRGESGQDFAQVSCFVPVDEALSLNQIYGFRSKMLQELNKAALDSEGSDGLWRDAWCAVGKLKVSSDKAAGEASVIAVGGDYFDFHPLRLLSGDYIQQSDLMKDRIVLSEEVAWLLFGGTDVAGMSMKLNGTPYVIAGVVEQEKDFFSKKSNSDGLDLYMSYDALLAIDENAKIDCYELVMANPVKGFAMKAVKDKFPIGRGEILRNSDRYDYEKMMDQVIHFGTRGSQTSGVVLPYWENAARMTEDWCALCCLLGTVSLLFPLIVLIILALQSGRQAKKKLEDEILPDLSEKTQEAIRKRQRRRWERRHGMHEEK